MKGIWYVDFSKARSDEMAEDGLLIILMPCPTNGTVASEFMLVHVF